MIRQTNKKRHHFTDAAKWLESLLQHMAENEHFNLKSIAGPRSLLCAFECVACKDVWSVPLTAHTDHGPAGELLDFCIGPARAPGFMAAALAIAARQKHDLEAPPLWVLLLERDPIGV